MRPTKYHDGLPDMLLEHMEMGLSFFSFGAVADCHVDSLYEWCKRYPEFSDAKKRGELRSLMHWEKIGNDAVNGNGDKFYSAPTYIYTMKCRFRKYGYNENDTSQEVEKFQKPPRDPSLELYDEEKSETD